MGQKKNPNRLTLFLTERELEMLEYIQKQEGQHNLTDIVHDCIKIYFKTAYQDKRYMDRGKRSDEDSLAPKVEELTLEQECERAGGKVETKNGIPMCVIKMSESITRSIPLSKPELF